MLIFICKNLLRSVSKAKILKSDFSFLLKWGRGKQVYHTNAGGPSRRRSCRKVSQDIASQVCDNKYNNCAFTCRASEQHSRRVLRVLWKQIVSVTCPSQRFHTCPAFLKIIKATGFFTMRIYFVAWIIRHAKNSSAIICGIIEISNLVKYIILFSLSISNIYILFSKTRVS